ncbi:MAG: hypothetical protein IKF14_13860 [Atopobiaceae bacterium]|nr:hypothetical protein [Atopobiaceae bacterium]MBR3160165.1 hypothetical protein [Atopobiaceae bacterium]
MDARTRYVFETWRGRCETCHIRVTMSNRIGGGVVVHCPKCGEHRYGWPFDKRE